MKHSCFNLLPKRFLQPHYADFTKQKGDKVCELDVVVFFAMFSWWKISVAFILVATMECFFAIMTFRPRHHFGAMAFFLSCFILQNFFPHFLLHFDDDLASRLINSNIWKYYYSEFKSLLYRYHAGTSRTKFPPLTSNLEVINVALPNSGPQARFRPPAQLESQE